MIIDVVIFMFCCFFLIFLVILVNFVVRFFYLVRSFVWFVLLLMMVCLSLVKWGGNGFFVLFDNEVNIELIYNLRLIFIVFVYL